MQILESGRKRREEKRKAQEQQQRLSQISKNRRSLPLHQRMEKDYLRREVRERLTRSKDALKKRSAEFRRVSLSEIAEHKARCEKLERERAEERETRRRSERAKSENRLSVLQKRSRASIAEELRRRDQLQRERELAKKKARKDCRRKMFSYANLTREISPVRPNPKKAEELKERIAQLKHPVRQRRDVKADYAVSKVLPRTRRSVNSSLLSNNKTADADTRRRKIELRRNCCDGRSRQNQHYVSEVKIKTKAKTQNTSMAKRARPNMYDWNADVADPRLTGEERYRRVMGKAAMIEQRAQLKEKVLRAEGGAINDFALGECVTDMLVDAVKAKLAALDNI